MFRTKFLFAFFVGICVATCVAPVKSLAGSCLCNGFTVFSDGEGSVQNTIENLCINIGHPNAEGIPINNQSDCDRIVKKQYNANDSVKCVFDASETCQSLSKCNGKDCFASDATCSTDTECEKLKFSDSSSAVGVCKNGHCFLDSVSLERYKNNPSLLGVTADLQLKKPIFEVRIPGLKFSDIGQAIDAQGYLHIPYLGEFVSLVYKLAMGLGSIVAVVMIIMQGAKIVVSGGGELKNEAYLRIGQIVIGLVILWGSYAILYTINPELVQFRVLKVKYIESVPLLAATETDEATDRPASPLGTAEKIVEIKNSHMANSMQVGASIADEIQAAADELYNETADLVKGPYMLAGGGYRPLDDGTQDSQVAKWERQCEGKPKCGTPVCNPFPANMIDKQNKRLPGATPDASLCPHTSGVALDIYCKGSSSESFFAPCQLKLEAIMLRKGFCRLTSEPWHFEKPKMSGSCSTSITGQARRNNPPKTWDYKNCLGTFTMSTGLCT